PPLHPGCPAQECASWAMGANTPPLPKLGPASALQVTATAATKEPSTVTSRAIFECILTGDSRTCPRVKPPPRPPVRPPGDPSRLGGPLPPRQEGLTKAGAA